MPKLLGCYEAEIHEILTQIMAKEYTEIVDIGCAEGYYANGLAMCMPTTSVYAFDIDPEARHFCETIAKLNNVQDRVIIAGHCDINELNTIMKGHPLIICDCGGL